MITIVFIASMLLAWYSFRRARMLKKYGREETATYKFLQHTFEFSAILGFVLLWYHLLLLFVTSGWQSVSAADLLRIEQALGAVQEVLDRYKLKSSTSLGVLLALYFLGVMRISWFEGNTVFSLFKKTKKLLHIANVLVFLLASFTLLGSEPGSAAATLEIRLQRQRNDYGLLRSEVNQALSGTAATRALDKVMQRFPGGAGTIVQVFESIDRNGDILRQTYTDTNARYELRDGRTEGLLARYERQRSAIERVSDLPGSSAAPSGIFPELPDGVTQRGIEAARDSLRAYEQRAHSRFLRLLTRPGGKDIALQLSEMPASKALQTLLKPVTESLPILKPALEVLTSTVIDALKVPIERKLDELTRAVAQNSEVTERLVEQAAKDVAESVPVNVPSEQARDYQRSLGQLKHLAKELEAGIPRVQELARSAEKVRNQQLLIRLENPKHDVRLRAAEELSARGDRLSRDQVDHVVGLMRNGTQKWTTSSTRQEGHHCTDYEDTAIRYYAGRALEQMQSPYVSESLRAEARRAQSNGRSYYRVTDPGWV